MVSPYILGSVVMGQDNSVIIRSHAQEREWLLSLGNGNIVAGVRSLVEKTKKDQDSAKSKSKKVKK